MAHGVHPAVKGVEIGMGFGAARVTGAQVHDEIEPAPGRTRAGNVRRPTNNAGGLEAHPDLDALHGGDGHDRRTDAAVQLPVPRDVRAEADG